MVLLATVGLLASAGAQQPAPDAPTHFLLDSGRPAHDEASSSHSPAGIQTLVQWGYNGQIKGSVEGIQTFDALTPGLLPEGSPERAWALARTEELRQIIKDSHAAGLPCYASTDLIVLPKALVEKLRGDICDERGRIDILRPKTQEVFRAMLRETFERVPDLDGLVIRTGEVYLHAFPYHTAGGDDAGQKQIQANTAILHGPDSHIALISILREEVCAARGKCVFYRTWDFGSFHEKPDYYLQVTNAIEPHANLYFSIKHQKGDFHQLTPFNPTLTIGRHRQIVEVQCQREAYGKGAHPYYVGAGVIDGWEEFAWMTPPGQPKGLRDIIDHPLCAGVWTWSRGGGWDGPRITNGLWCDLNAYVVAKFAENPRRSEEEIFAEYAHGLGLGDADVARFRELNLLSAKAVLRGQLTCLGGKINVWWARDDTLKDPGLDDFVKKGLVEKAIAEKAEAVAMWRRIEELARQIDFHDPATQDFVETSAEYGRIKYDLIRQAWTVILLGKSGDASKKYDRARIEAALAAYDQLWVDWKRLHETHPSCSTIYRDAGIGQAVGRYRNLAVE